MNEGAITVQGSFYIDASRCVVRVTTTAWADKRGLHEKKSLMFLRRQCKGLNVLEEDASAIGAENVLPRILNLDECEDGVYDVVVCNERCDYETGYVGDYDYRLVRANAQREALLTTSTPQEPSSCT